MLGAFADAAGAFLRARGIVQLHGVKREASVDEMYMRVVEAGKKELGFGIDHARVGASPIIDIGIGADRDNAIAEDCDRLRGGIGFVYRPDFGVGDDEIGSGTGLGSGD